MSGQERKHTPGPWRAAIAPDVYQMKGEDENEVACLPHVVFDAVDIFAPRRDEVCPHSCELDEFKANAHLIAASPELVEALEYALADLKAVTKKLVQYEHGREEPSDEIKMAEATLANYSTVLAKARGDQS